MRFRMPLVGTLHLLITHLMVVFAVSADPVAQSFTYQGRLMNAAGNAPMTGTVDLRIGILSPNGTCLLYEELHTGINLNTTNGVFSVEVGSTPGSAKRTANDPNLLMSSIFANSGAEIVSAGPNCVGGYTPASGEHRLLSVTVIQGASEIVLSPHQKIMSQPSAMVAETLQGIGPDGLIRVDAPNNLTQANIARLVGGGDVSDLHTHDDRYVRLDSSSQQNLGSGGVTTGGNVITTGQLGVGVATPAGGVDIHVRDVTPTIRLESTDVDGSAGAIEFLTEGTAQGAKIETRRNESILRFETGGSEALSIEANNRANFSGSVSVGEYLVLGTYNGDPDPSEPGSEAGLLLALDACGAACVGTLWSFKANPADASAPSELKMWMGDRAVSFADFSGSHTAGGVIYSDGSSFASTGAGTAGQVLVSDGDDPPTWTSELELNQIEVERLDADLVQMNALGRFGLGAFTTAQEAANLTGGAIPLTGADAGKVWYNTTLDALRYWDGDNIQTVGVSGLGLASLNTQTEPVQSFAAPEVSGTAMGWSSSGGVHTLRIPLASTAAVTAGLISNVDFDRFEGKQDQSDRLDDISNLTPVDGNFVMSNASNLVLGTPEQARLALGLNLLAGIDPANFMTRSANLSDVTDPVAARNHLGLGPTTIAAEPEVNYLLVNGTRPMTGPLRSVAGTAAAPGLTFDGNLNTGIYQPAANTLALNDKWSWCWNNNSY